MCIVCAGVAAAAIVVAGVKQSWPKPSSNYPPPPKPMPFPVAVYGEDMDD